MKIFKTLSRLSNVTILLSMAAIMFFDRCSKSKSNPAPVTPVAITSLSVNTGPYTTPVVITGTGFSTTLANNQVFFNGKAATITAATSTQITTTVPLGAGTGNVTISVNSAAAVMGPVFTYQLAAFVSTLAGKADTSGSANGTGNQATFYTPTGIAVDVNGNVFVADLNNNLIREISPRGVVSTFAGSGNIGTTNGTGTAASFYQPYVLTIDASGNLYVAEGTGDARKITPQGVVSLLPGSASAFAVPNGIAIDSAKNVYVSDYQTNLIIKITQAGTESVVAGNGIGNVNGKGTGASFHYPAGMAADASGNIYIADGENNLIRKMTPDGTVTTFAGSGNNAHADGTGTGASFRVPWGLAFDAAGNLYVADRGDGRIRKITSAGVVTTVAGNGTTATVNGIGTNASFYDPYALAVDTKGNIYVADGLANTVRKIVIQ